MIEARLKRLHIQDDFISWHSRKGKLSGQKIEQASPGASDEEEADSQKGLWGDGDENVLYLNYINVNILFVIVYHSFARCYL